VFLYWGLRGGWEKEAGCLFLGHSHTRGDGFRGLSVLGGYSVPICLSVREGAWGSLGKWERRAGLCVPACVLAWISTPDPKIRQHTGMEWKERIA
jgi:hypothetical protein